MLIAKPVIDKQFWILQENNRKVGNIEACAGGYQVKINNQVAQFKTIKMAARQINISFEDSVKSSKTRAVAKHVYDYPAAGRVHNPMWDVPQRLPVYTKTDLTTVAQSIRFLLRPTPSSAAILAPTRSPSPSRTTIPTRPPVRPPSRCRTTWRPMRFVKT